MQRHMIASVLIVCASYWTHPCARRLVDRRLGRVAYHARAGAVGQGPGTRAGLTTRAFSDIRLPFLVFVAFLVLPSFLSRFKWLPTGTSSAISVPSVLPPLAPQRDTMDALLNAAACVARTLFLWLHSARLQSTVLFFVAAHYREKSVERMWRW